LSLQNQAAKVAAETNSPIKHPIVDKIRQFSPTAIDFFTLLLHPMLHRRLGAKDALAHVYLQGCLPQMLDDFVVPQAAISTRTAAGGM
jgi:hypothetical protein